MTVPAAPTEAGGDKILFVVADSGGTNIAALLRAIGAVTLNGDEVAHLGVATHVDAGGEPTVVTAGYDGSTVRSVIVDPLGRAISRPLAAYDSSGSIAYAHARAIGRITVDSEAVGHLGVGTHEHGGAFGSTDPVVVLAGVSAGAAKSIAADASGRLITSAEPAFGGSGFKAIASTDTRVALGSSLSVRKVLLRAPSGNSGIIYVGGSGVTRDTVEATGGYQLAAGGTLEIPVSNRNLVYINGVSGDGVSYLYWT